MISLLIDLWKRWGPAITGGLLLAVGAGWLWRRERRKRLDATARLEVARLREKIATAKAVREGLVSDAGDHTIAIAGIDRSITAHELDILAAHDEPLEGLTRDQIRARLRDLGY